MEKENFYLLLELRIDPPENDPKVITKALKEKQTQWSRYRNHPTKAIQAKRYIGLIPEIKKVMSDPKLRKQEALKAKKIILERDQEQFVKIDHHIKLLTTKDGIDEAAMRKIIDAHKMDEDKIRARVKKREPAFVIEREIENLAAKGKLDDKRIEALAKTHSVEPDAIKKIVERKNKEKIDEIDRHLAFRIRRGYVTEQAISELAALYDVDEDFIYRRVKCPIRKKSDKKKDKPAPLDSSIEKSINDNLKIVNKTSLYDFLGVVPSTSLENLQKRAKEKEMELRNTGQKNAVTTAGSVLAGQCMSIFKSEQNRNAYELTLTRVKTAALDSEIRIAEINGKIRAESAVLLMRSAIQIGLDPEEAREYLQDFAKKENLSIDIPSKKKRRQSKKKAPIDRNKLIIGAAAAAVVILVLLILRSFMSGNVEQEYRDMMLKVQKTEQLETKSKILKQFVKDHKPSEYTTSARKEERKIRKLLDTRKYEEVNEQGKKLVAEKKYEDAINHYNEFIHADKQNRFVDEARAKVDEIESLIDERDYRAAADSNIQDYGELIDKYNYYLQMHPDGKYAETVKKQIDKTIADHFQILKTELSKFEQKREWETCIRITDYFIDKYGQDEHASELKSMRARYENNLRANTAIASLREKAAEKGEDFEAAINVYTEYLRLNPEVSSQMRKDIAGDVEEIEKRREIYQNRKKAWEDTAAYCTNDKNPVSKRLERIENYVQTNTAGPYMEEAKALLEKVRAEKEKEDLRLFSAKEESAWRKLVTDARNDRISLADRIDKTKTFLKTYGSGKFAQDAKKLQAQLIREKREEDERIRKANERKALRDQEIARLRAALKQSGGRFVDNGDGTVKDTRTGLTWVLADSTLDLGVCIDYYKAVEYVKSLKTGGHTDWRLPATTELAGVYKTRPFFPSGNTPWYWSVNVVVKGWNKKAYIVTTKQNTDWTKIEADLDQCGAVRAVRD